MAAGLVLLGAGCVSFGPSEAGSGSAGGIFRSVDRGDVWANKSALLTATGERRTFGASSVGVIVQDPQDPKAIYVGTAEHGMFYSYDSGESWSQPAGIRQGRVWSVAIHPRDKCTIFVTVDNKVAKSDDCSRTWSVPFLDSRTEARTKVVAIDGYNPNVIWVAMSTGDLLRSQDSGVSWSNVHSFKNDIMRLVISPSDSRRIFVATRNAGIWRTDDAGANWLDLSKNYEDFSKSKEFLDLAIGVSDPGVVIFASKYGLIRSRDFGDSWEKIDLLTPPGQSIAYSLAIDPKNSDNIYFGTATTFNKSTNGGANWITKRLPTTRAATVLRVDQANSDVIWMGVTKFDN